MRSAVFLLLTTLFASSVAAQDMGADAELDATADMGPDAAMDMGVDQGTDLSTMDAATDAPPDPPDTGDDAGVDATPDATTVADSGADATPDAAADASDMGPVTFTFSGLVTLTGASDSGAVSAQLMGPSYNSVTYTDTDGAFAFGGLQAGDYTLELAYPGYTTVRDSLTLGADTYRTYTLDAESTVAITVAVSFVGTPAEVHVAAKRGLLRVDADIPANDGLAIWEAPLPTGVWEAAITAPGYATHTLVIDATGEPREYLVTLSAPTAPGFEATSQCACATINTRTDVPWLVLPLLIGGLLVRRRRA